MADTSASIRLRAIDQGLIGTVDKATNAFTGLTVGALAAEKAFQGLGFVSRTSVGQMLLGAQNADKLAGAMGNLASKSSTALAVFGKLSDIGFGTSVVLNLAKGVQEAAIAYSRIPATLDLMNRSGVQTQSIQDFEQLREAIRGNEASLEQFAVSAVANLGKFEQAAARAGTILRSSTRFDVTGQAQRATAGEQMQNALQVQKLVNGEIRNTVSSTEALLGQYQVLSANFTKTADSQKVLASGLKLVGIGRAGGVAADPVATLDLLSKTLNAYELSADDAAKTGAILNGVIERGLTTVPELSLNFADTAKTAKTAGISLVDLGSGVATLTAQGVGTAQALTGIERLANTVINKTPESSAALAKLSQEAGKPIRFDVAEVQAKGFTQALIDLNVAAKGNVQVLSEIFPEAIAFQTVIKLLAQDGRKLADNTASLGTVTAGSLDEVFKLATGDRLSRLEQIANRFQELLIEIAQNIAPVFEPGIKALEGISNFFSSMPDWVKRWIGNFIVFQIQSKAATSAVGILLKTLFDLGSAYLQVRAFSLLLSGQLGKEVAVIRDLITQRKGLLAVGLQMFGIDQRSRLAIENTTAALEKQNIVTKLLSGAREKLSGVGAANLAGFKQQATDNAAVVSGAISKGVGDGIAQAPGVFSKVGGAITGSQTYQALKSQGQQIVQNNQFLQGAIASASTLSSSIRTDIGGAIDAVTGRAAQPKQLELFDSKQYASTSARLGQFVEQGKDKLEELKGKAGEVFGAKPPTGQLDLFDTGDYQAKGAKISAEATKAINETTNAIKARAIATGQSTAAEVTHQTVTRASMLAEKGLAEARIFGSNVQFATTGPMGALNKLLVTEINLKTASAAASTTWAGTAGVLKGSLKGVSVALGATVTGFTSLAQMGGKAISGGLNAVVSFLGPATPLFLAAGAAALIFKDQIWGLGAASRELSKSFDEAITKNAELQKQFGTDRRLLAFKEQVGAVGDSAQVADLDPVRQQLIALQNSGSITTGQFNQLARSLDAVGEGGTVNAGKLKEFKSQLDAIRQGAQGDIEEGMWDKIGGGLKKTWDATINAPKNIAATVGGALTLPVDLAFGNATLEDAIPENWGKRLLQAQDADALIKPMSQLGKAQEQVGQEFLRTKQAVKDYSQGLGLTDEASEKLRRGAALTTADLEREQQQFEQRRKSNDQLISSYEKSLEETAKTAEKVKDPEFKAQLLAQADALRSQTDALKGSNEQLKAGYDNMVKYQQVLKDLKAALVDTTDPTKAIAAAQDDFNQKFIVDAKGRITPFLKDINTLRTEAGRYAESITSATQYASTGPVLSTAQRAAIEANNPLAVIEKQGIGYQDAAQRLRQVRDDMLKLPSGEQGYRLSLDQRRELTKSIVDMDQNAARERMSANEVAIDKERLLQTTAKQNAEETERKITAITIDQTKQQLQIKEAQIKELRGMRLKTTAEEAESEKLRIRIAQLAAEQEEREYERRQQRRIKQVENETPARTLALQKQLQANQLQSKNLELNGQLASSRNKLFETQAGAFEQGLQNQAKLTGDAVVRAQLEEKVVQKRLQSLPVTQAAEREQLKIQIQLNQLSLDRESIQARIAKIENQRALLTAKIELQRAIREKRTPEEIQGIQLQIQGLEQQSELLDQQAAQTEKAKAQNREIAANSQKELEIRQKTAQETAKVEAQLARIAVQQALINREIARNNNEATAQTQALQKIIGLSEVRSKNLELDQQLASSRTSLIEAELTGVESITQAQLKLVGDAELRSQLEREIVERRAANLPIAQSAERESLQVQIQLNRLGLEREATQARIAKIENERNLKQAQLELQKAQLEKKSPEDIKAIELQIQGLEQQGELLDQREGQTNRVIAQSKELSANQLKELDIRQRTATVNAQVELTLARAAQKQAAITKQVQIIELLSQQRQLDLQGETKQLEAQNQKIDQRKQLLEAQQNIIKGQIESQTSQLSIASEATKSELKRRELAQAIAAIRLRSVLQQISYERQVLELNQQQQKMALEREKTQNRIAQSTNLADIAKAQAEIAKIQASPTATPLEMAAAQMQLRARLEEQAGLRYSGALLEQRGQVEERLRGFERQGQDQRYAAQYNQARLDFAQTLPEGRQREAMRQLYNDALSVVVGNAGQQGVRGIRDLAESQFFGANRAGLLYGGSGYAQPLIPNIQAPNYEKYRRDALAQFQEFAVKPPDLSAQIRDLTVRSPQVKVPALEQALQQQQQQPTKQGDTHFNIEINLPPSASTKEIPQQLNTGEVVKVFSDIWSRVKQMRS